MTHDETTRLHPPASSASDGSASDDPLNALIADYLQQVDAGTAPDRDEFIAAHPDFEQGLREYFIDLDHFDAGPALVDATQDNDPLERIRYFGEYVLTREIARGGMGVVYEAHQKTLNRTVAVKMILAGMLASEEDVKRFRTEAQAAAGLQHGGIVSIHEVGVCQGQHYFSMDFIDGCSLAELVRDASLPVEQAARYVKQIGEAVQFAHEEGILHRDLKPANILIDSRTDEPRITDFGLAEVITDDSGLTATGARLGTPSYMSPEQASGEAECVGPATDIYALGAILYELLTGRPPFRGSTAIQTLTMVINRHPVPPRQLNDDIPRDIETVCLKCLSKDPEDRYASAAELAADIERFLNDEPILGRRIGPLERTRRWFWKRRFTAVTLAAIVMIAAGVDYSRRQQAAWEESQKGILHFESEGPPLTTTLRNIDGELAVPRFTSPTAEPVRIKPGEYEMELSGSGMMSAKYSLFVEAERQVSVPVELPRTDVADPISIEGHLHIVELDGRAAGMIVGQNSLSRIDVLTGETLWKTDFEQVDVLSQAGTRWQDFTGLTHDHEMSLSRPVSTAWDVNGDGTDDIVWVGHGPVSAIAFSGKDGAVLWTHHTAPEIPAEVQRTGTKLAGPPSIIETGEGSKPDLLLTFDRRHTRSESGLRTRWVEWVSGQTGETLWRYRVASLDTDQPMNAGPGFVVPLEDGEAIVLPTDRALVRVDRNPDVEHVNLAGGARSTVHDLDGDGRRDLLLEYDWSRRGHKTTAVDLDGNTLWSHTANRKLGVQLIQPAQPRTVGNDNKPQTLDQRSLPIVAIVSTKYANKTEHWNQRLELLDAATGNLLSSDEWSVPGDEFDGESLRLFVVPDLDGDDTTDLVASWRQTSDNELPVVHLRAWSTDGAGHLWDAFMDGLETAFVADIQPWNQDVDGFPLLVVSCTANDTRTQPEPGPGTTHIFRAATGQHQATLDDVLLPRMADLNADGLDDLYWTELKSYDAYQPQYVLRSAAGQSPEAWRRVDQFWPAADFDNDGITDLLLRDMTGHLAAFSGRTNRKLWHANRNAGRPTEASIALQLPHGDLDGDGGADLLEFRKSKSQQHDLIATSGRTGQTIWIQSGWVTTKYSPGLAFAECVESNGQKQLIVGARITWRTTTASWASINPVSGETLWKVQNTEPRGRGEARIEIDPVRNEFIQIVGTSSSKRLVTARSLTDGEVLWQREYAARRRRLTDDWFRLPIADLNGDGALEYLSMGDGMKVGFTAHSCRTGEPVWTWTGNTTRDRIMSQRLALGDLAIADLGVVDHKSVCFRVEDRLLVLDGAGQDAGVEIELSKCGVRPDDDMLLAVDLDTDGRDELLLFGSEANATDQPSRFLFALDTTQWQIKWKWQLPAGDGEIVSITKQDDSGLEIIARSGSTVYGLDGSGKVQWTCTGPNTNRTPKILGRSDAGAPYILFRPLVEAMNQYECRVAVPAQSVGSTTE